jgi:hypothetical protein
MNFTGVEDVLLSRKPAASFWALRMSSASCVRNLFSFNSTADSTGFRLARFLSPSTVMMGSNVGFGAFTFKVEADNFSPSGFIVGGLL